MGRGRFEIARCAMQGVDAVSADTAHAFGRHTHEQFGIGVVLRGAQKSSSGRGMVQAQAGDLITVNPGEVHDGSPLDASGRAWRMLYFVPQALAGHVHAVTEGRADGAEFLHPVLHDAAAAACFLSLFRALTDPHGGYSEIESRERLLQLLARLLERGRQALAPAPGIARARERIDDDPCAPLSLAELAAVGGVSQFQLVRGFSKATGLTPHAYLVQRRLQRARALIARGASLADAAHSAGFSDQSHLTRLFVRAYGISPGRYAAAMA